MKKIASVPKNGTLKRKEEIERPYDAISLRLNDWKNETGIIQEKIAKEAKISVSTLRLVFSGIRAPSLPLLEYLRNEHGLDLNWLITGKK